MPAKTQLWSQKHHLKWLVCAGEMEREKPNLHHCHDHCLKTQPFCSCLLQPGPLSPWPWVRREHHTALALGQGWGCTPFLASPVGLISVSTLSFCFPMGDMTAIIRNPEASSVINQDKSLSMRYITILLRHTICMVGFL